jgi:hypothetical protein
MLLDLSKTTLKTAQFTAEIGGSYRCRATHIGAYRVLDPAGVVSGDMYQCICLGPTHGILFGIEGSLTRYSPSSIPVIRVFNGSTWYTLPTTITENPIT